jgi:hypothetical protein
MPQDVHWTLYSHIGDFKGCEFGFLSEDNFRTKKVSQMVIILPANDDVTLFNSFSLPFEEPVRDCNAILFSVITKPLFDLGLSLLAVDLIRV